MFGAADCFAAPAVGQTCTANVPGLAALTLANVAGGSIAVFDVQGLFDDSIDTSAYAGLFSIQFAGMSYQELIAALVTQQTVTGLYSASFTTDGRVTPTPEPGSAVLVISAAVLVSVLGRRLRKARTVSIR